MSHRIPKRSIFALLDGRLSGFQEKKFKDHLAACSTCRSYLEVIEQVKRLAREAVEIPEPDWGRIDRTVDRTIAEISAKQKTNVSWVPMALALAAAAAVALAVLLPSIRSAEPLDAPMLSEPDVAEETHFSKNRTLDFLTAWVLDNMKPDEPPQIGQALDTGQVIATSDCGGVMIALGSEALLETGEASRLELLSLDAESPAIEMLGGRLIVSVKPMSFGYERGLAVLAGGASFNVLSGIVEFVYSGDSLAVMLIDGEVIADETLGGASLSPGMWKVQKSADSRQWLAMDVLDGMQVNEISTISPLDEQEPRASRFGGTLPVHLIKESLALAKPKIRDCYEKALKRDPNLTLSVDVKIEIGRFGAVTSAKAAGLDNVPQMKKCIEQILLDVHFPQPQGGPIEVVFPLLLYPKI
jgi:hypothetical protein